tara:strand:- start:310 stop:567 length:258 start_codon:yes stop_codon:yes gene_type:complete
MRKVTETRYIADLLLPTNTPKTREVNTKFGSKNIEEFDLRDCVVKIDGEDWEFNVWTPKDGKPKISLQRWVNNSSKNEETANEIV